VADSDPRESHSRGSVQARCAWKRERGESSATGGTEAKAFAITVESEAGAAAPTTPILMMGAGE